MFGHESSCMVGLRNILMIEACANGNKICTRG
jgi:hypothetical protein